MEVCDFLVIGAGVIGINVAHELSRRYPGTKILLIDKESSEAQHASGRNSGVLHAGFYYTADSFKARFTRDGNAALTKLCERKNLPIRKCGKLVVARSEQEISGLDVLMERARNNGVRLEKVTEDEARKIEPKAKTVDYALYSPTTASVDPKIVVSQMKQDAIASGVEFRFGISYLKKKSNQIETSAGAITPRYLVNAAGLYADKIAKDFGFSEHYDLLPFKGLYLYSTRPKGSLNTHIYPVPDLSNPFLGVHFTVAIDGSIKIGPTAIPAFWREQYKGLDNFCFSELRESVLRQMGLFAFSGFDFHRLAYEEMKKYFKRNMIRQASRLADSYGVGEGVCGV